jgi:hypothetical protein
MRKAADSELHGVLTFAWERDELQTQHRHRSGPNLQRLLSGDGRFGEDVSSGTDAPRIAPYPRNPRLHQTALNEIELDAARRHVVNIPISSPNIIKEYDPIYRSTISPCYNLRLSRRYTGLAWFAASCPAIAMKKA